jgi:hypothetical protein
VGWERTSLPTLDPIRLAAVVARMAGVPSARRTVGVGTALAVGAAVAAVAAYRSERGKQLAAALGDYLDAFASSAQLSKRLTTDLHTFLTQPTGTQEDGDPRSPPVRALPPLHTPSRSPRMMTPIMMAWAGSGLIAGVPPPLADRGSHMYRVTATERSA